MKSLLKLEEAAIWGASIYLFATLPYDWWWYPLLLFLPDASMIGYVWGTAAGAYVYNFWHHRAIALLVLVLGYWIGADWLKLAGCVLSGHIAMDRFLGYGLKLVTGFGDTHLGRIGREEK